MKKEIKKEVTFCDRCKKEGYVTVCLNCGVEHCYECQKTSGKTYKHRVYFSGFGDGYYCNDCNADLLKSGTDDLFNAYQWVYALRLELEAYNADFEKRMNEAEENLKRVQ